MKVVNNGKKAAFTPISLTVTFESRKEMVDFIEGAREVVEQGYACDLEDMLDLMKEELSK